MRELTKVTKHNVVAFNYEGLDPKIRQSVKGHAEQVNVLLERTASSIIAIGQHLSTVRDALTPTLFQRWVFASFDFAPDTAMRYILVARRFADLPAAIALKFQPHALHLLSNGKLPPKAVNEALSRAKAGEPITAGKAKEIIHQHRPPEARKISRSDQQRLGQYLVDMTKGKDVSELPEVADELQRQADRLRAKAGGNGHAAKNCQANGKPASNGKTDGRHVYSVRVSLSREFDQRETRLLRPLIEDLRSEEFDDPGCQVEAIDAEAEVVA